MHTRLIPSSGEQLPVIGCGTYRGFDVDFNGAAFRQLREVLDSLFAAGGSVIDSSPMDGRAEAVGGICWERRMPAARHLSPRKSGLAAERPALLR